MKNTFTLVLLSCLFINSTKINAQLVAEQVFEGTSVFGSMVVDENNNLYYSEPFDRNFFSYDLNNPDGSNPSFITNVDGTFNPHSIGLYNNDLYFSNAQGLYKFDITIIAPQFETVFLVNDYEFNFGDIQIIGDDLFLIDSDTNKILKSDLTVSPIIFTDFLQLDTGSFLRAMTIKGDVMYISAFKEDPITLELLENKIITVNLNDATPLPVDLIVVDTTFFITDIIVNNDLLYMSSIDSIFTIDLNNITEETNLIIDNIVPNLPIESLVINNNNLYFFIENIVYRIALETLSVNPIESKTKVKLHPNPSSDFIAISGLTENKNYKIYNTLGALVKEGTTSNNEKINIKSLANGIYYTKFKNSNTVKFVKK